jgi:hypothetical protein
MASELLSSCVGEPFRQLGMAYASGPTEGQV